MQGPGVIAGREQGNLREQEGLNIQLKQISNQFNYIKQITISPLITKPNKEIRLKAIIMRLLEVQVG